MRSGLWSPSSGESALGGFVFVVVIGVKCDGVVNVRSFVVVVVFVEVFGSKAVDGRRWGAADNVLVYYIII